MRRYESQYWMMKQLAKMYSGLTSKPNAMSKEQKWLKRLKQREVTHQQAWMSGPRLTLQLYQSVFLTRSFTSFFEWSSLKMLAETVDIFLMAIPELTRMLNTVS
jgi:hypothetical protein